MLTKKLYEQATGRSQKSNVIAYQIRQSFRPGEITAEEANRIGYELASRFLKGKHAFILTGNTSTTISSTIPLHWTAPGNFGIFSFPVWQCSD